MHLAYYTLCRQLFLILPSGRSDVFDLMMKADMLEKKNNNIDLDLDEDIAEEMIRFMYTGKVQDLKEIAEELIDPAVMVSHECRCHMHIDLLHLFCYIKYS